MDPEGPGQGAWTPLKNHKNIDFLSNTGLVPLKIDKTNKPSFNFGPSSACQRNTICWRADYGLLLVVFGSFLPSSTKNSPKNRQRCRIGLSLTKLSGSVHD